MFSTGLEEEEFSISYQNPTSESLDLISANSLPLGTVASLYSTDGRLMLQQRVQGYHNSINVSNLSNGMYILNLQNANSINFSEKIMVVK